MDIIRNQKRKKKEFERTSETPSQGKHTENIIKKDRVITAILNGEIIRMSNNLKDLSEIDYDDAKVQKWVAKQDEKWKKKYKGFTHQDIFDFVDLRKVLQEQNPNFTSKQAATIALKTIRTKKRLKNREV